MKTVINFSPTDPEFVQKLRESLSYDPTTGILTRLKNFGQWRAGSIAGTLNEYGYIQIYFLGKIYKAHRLAWAIQFGYFPLNDLDHIDGNRSNNKLENLREATRSENLQNTKPRINNTSGFKGVTQSSRNPNIWTAHINHSGKKWHLGSFSNPEDAYKAYCEASLKYHGEFGHIN